MAFNSRGQFIPTISSQNNMQAQQPAAINQQAMQNASPVQQTNMAMAQNNPNSRTNMSALKNNADAFLAPSSTLPATAPTAVPSQMVQPQVQAQPMQQPMQQLGYMPRFQYPQMPMPSQSVQQQASMSPQSVQNYMSALNAVGAGSNNRQMSMPGQGQGPAYLGSNMMPQQGYGPSFINPGYLGPMNSGLNFYGNQAYAYPNYYAQNQAQQGGYGAGPLPYAQTGGTYGSGTGGVAGQPSWQEPAPWKYNEFNGMNTQSRYDYLMGKPNVNIPDQMQGPYYGNELGTVSDENAKTNIQSAPEELDEFMDKLGIWSYEYKNPAHGDKRYIGPMAQEIESTKLGKDSIVHNEQGYKMVNTARLSMVQLSALALLHQRQKELEQKLAQALSKKKGKK